MPHQAHGECINEMSFAYELTFYLANLSHPAKYLIAIEGQVCVLIFETYFLYFSLSFFDVKSCHDFSDI